MSSCTRLLQTGQWPCSRCRRCTGTGPLRGTHAGCGLEWHLDFAWFLAAVLHCAHTCESSSLYSVLADDVNGCCCSCSRDAQLGTERHESLRECEKTLRNCGTSEPARSQTHLFLLHSVSVCCTHAGCLPGLALGAALRSRSLRVKKVRALCAEPEEQFPKRL